MHLKRSLMLAAAGSPFLGGIALAQPLPDPRSEEELVTVRAFLEHSGAVPGGTVWVGFRLDIKDGWHTYWPGQNDTGYGSDIKPIDPSGLEFGPAQWPAPHRYTLPGDILDHIHEDRVTALVPVTVPVDAVLGTSYEVRFEVSWLVCQEVCIPGDTVVSVNIPVVASPTPNGGEAAEAIQAARSRIPEPAVAGKDLLNLTRDGAAVTVRVRGANGLAFYPDADSARVEGLLASGTTKTDTLVLTLSGTDQVLSGVLEVFSRDGRSRLFQVRSEPDRAGE
jgi:DsbC/DsbD-like thiol-disulfide interchange protein